MIDKFLSLLRSFSTSPLAPINFLTRLDNTLKEILMNQAELKAALEAVQAKQDATNAVLVKVVGEVQALITALANTPNALDPSVEEAINKLVASSGTNSDLAKQLDELNADALEVPGTPS